MFLSREGFPEEGEFVLCTVTKITYNSVFVKLQEYNHSGLIHISEISPGRIRNIRDYVVEGKVVVCLVLKVNQERGYIDLSLRRVNEMEKKKKIEKIKQEQKAEKLIENYAKLNKLDAMDLYQQVAKPLLEHYEYIHSAFYDVVEGNAGLEKLGVKKELARKLEPIILEKIKPKEVLVEGRIFIKFFDSDGLGILKNVLAAVLDNSTSVKYEGGGKYRISVRAKEYKGAEKSLKQKVESLQADVEEHKGEFSFERIEVK